MRVFLHLQKLATFIKLAFGHAAVPGPDRHIGNGVVVTGHVAVRGQVLVQHVHLAFDFHGKAVDGVFDLDRRIGIKVPEATAQIRCAAHLPKQPRQAFGALRGLGGQENAKLFG